MCAPSVYEQLRVAPQYRGCDSALADAECQLYTAAELAARLSSSTTLLINSHTTLPIVCSNTYTAMVQGCCMEGTAGCTRASWLSLAEGDACTAARPKY